MTGKMNDHVDAPQIIMLSNDCVADTPGSRLKVYFLSSADTLAKFKDMYHLGGRLNGPKIDASLENISEFWYHLFVLDPSDPASDDKVCAGLGAFSSTRCALRRARSLTSMSSFTSRCG
jgi:hypothetical protein